MSPFTLLLAVAMVFAAAESPFVGTWKLNPTKSQFAGMTMTFDQLPSGEMKTTSEGQSYTFKTDGKEYPAIFGMTAAWKQIDPNTWEATYKMQGQVSNIDKVSVSPDGKTLTIDSKGKRPDGTSFENSATFERVGSGQGLAGKWKTTKVSLAPETIEFAAYEDDGLTFRIPGYNASANMKFDGKDNRMTGAVPPGFTVAVTSKGPRSFEMIEKMSGKVVYRGTYTLSEDGKTLSAVFTPEGTTEKVTEVYDRQ
jgi:hypothetical protein